MSNLSGFTNNGLNQSLNGIVSLTDGVGTTISEGVVTTNSIVCDDLVLNDINVSGTATIDDLVVTGTSNLTGLLTLSSGIDSNGGTIDHTGNVNIGTSLVVGSFTNINGILRMNAGSQLGTSQTLEMKTGSMINANALNISDVEVSYLEGGTQNINTAITTLQTKCTDISYSGGVTTIANNVTLGTSPADICTIAGRADIGDICQIASDCDVGNDLDVVNDVTIGGTLDVTGTTNLDGFLTLAHGLQNNAGTISTVGNVNVGTTLTVANTGTFNGSVKMNAGGELGTSQTLTMKAGSIINTNSLNISDVELSYLDGVTSNIQTQINTGNTNITTLQTKCTDISYSGGVTTIANDLDVDDDLTVGGNTTLNNTIVNGTTTLNNGLFVTTGGINMFNNSGSTNTFEILDYSGNALTNIYSSYFSNKFVIDNTSLNSNGFSFAYNGSDVLTLSNTGNLSCASITGTGDLTINGNVTLGDNTSDTVTITSQPYFALNNGSFPTTTSTRTGLELWRNASGGDGEVDFLSDTNAGTSSGYRFYTRHSSLVPTLLLKLTTSQADFQGLNFSTTGTLASGAQTVTGSITATGDVYANSGMIGYNLTANGTVGSTSISSASTVYNIVSLTLNVAGTYIVTGNIPWSWGSSATTGQNYVGSLSPANNSISLNNTCIQEVEASTTNSKTMNVQDIYTSNGSTVVYLNFMANTLGTSVSVNKPLSNITAIRIK